MTIGTDLSTFDCRCQGESHKATGKPCQDYSFSETTPDHSIAIVSDGHGGARYFRSDVGSRLLVEVTARRLAEYAKGTPSNTFTGQPYTAVGIGDTMPPSLQQLFGAIVVGWRAAVMAHADLHPLTEAEQSIAVPGDEHEWEKTYGCTLLALLRTPSYWLAFQVGDGKCVAIRDDATPFEPIPWDDRCFLNRTTSICDTDALSNFRCCFGTADTAPVAIFIGSDGVDDSFGEADNLHNFYIQLAKGFAVEGHESTVGELRQLLPFLSQRGSQDDMSVAGLYDSRCRSLFPLLVQWQTRRLRARIDTLSQKIVHLWANLPRYNEVETRLASKELSRCRKDREALKENVKRLEKELWLYPQ